MKSTKSKTPRATLAPVIKENNRVQRQRQAESDRFKKTKATNRWSGRENDPARKEWKREYQRKLMRQRRAAAKALTKRPIKSVKTVRPKSGLTTKKKALTVNP